MLATELLAVVVVVVLAAIAGLAAEAYDLTERCGAALRLLAARNGVSQIAARVVDDDDTLVPVVWQAIGPACVAVETWP